MSPIIAPWRKHEDHNCPVHSRITAPRPPRVDYHCGPRKKKAKKPEAEGFDLRVMQVGIVLGLRSGGMCLQEISASLGYPAPWAGWVIEEAERRGMV
jgi:hypothetical protein